MTKISVPFAARKKLFQPGDRVDVEMVRRLVEQQQVGLRRQGPGQQHAAFHAGRERGELDVRRQFHPRQNLLDLLFRVPRRFVVVRIERHARRDDVVNRADHVLRHVLRQQRDLRAGRDHDLAAVGLDLAAEHPHQRRLAGAVAAEQADPLAGVDLARDAVQERRPAKTDAKIAKRNQRHDNPARLYDEPQDDRGKPSIMAKVAVLRRGGSGDVSTPRRLFHPPFRVTLVGWMLRRPKSPPPTTKRATPSWRSRSKKGSSA